MIIDDTPLGRFAFIFDINTLKAFRGSPFISFDETCWWPERLHTLTKDDLIEQLKPMDDWLSERTKAYRINAVTMVYDDHKDMISALLVQVPIELAVVFRLFWYDFD